MTRVTRVLWLAKGLGRGGAEMLLAELAEALRDAPLQVDCAYVLPHKSAMVPRLEAAGVRVRCLATADKVPWPTRLRQLLRDERYDVVHSHAPVIGAVARVSAPRRTTLVHTEHNTWQRYRVPTRWANALTMRRNTVVWPVSQGVATSFRRWPGPGSWPRVEVMLHGIAPGNIAAGPVARRDARRALGLDPGVPAVVTVGNLTPKKDHDTMLHAFRLLLDGVPDAQLVVIGDGPRRAHLEALVQGLGLQSHVQMLGVRDDVPALLAGFDAFAMSSLHEGLSIALLEAMHAGVVPVATRVGGIPELVTDEVNGLLVRGRDSAALAISLRTVLTDQALRERLAVAATARAADFGIDTAAGRLRETYVELAGLGAQHPEAAA